MSDILVLPTAGASPRDVANRINQLIGAERTGSTDLTALTTRVTTAEADITALQAADGVLTAAIATKVEALTANRTYYVRGDGSDSNTGLANTSGGAFLTLQKAWDTIAGLYFSGFTVTIQVADATYTAGINATTAWSGGGALNITGNTGTPANCIVNATTNAFRFQAPLPGTVNIRGFTITSSAGSAFLHETQGKVTHSSNVLGAVAAYHCAVRAPGARLESGTYTISGSPSIAGWHASKLGVVYQSGGTITLTGTPAWGVAGAQAIRNGLIFLDTVTFSGAATGVRYTATLGGGIDTLGGGASFIPGNSAGSATSPGWYN